VRQAARELAAQCAALTAILADPDVLAAFGARDMWQVVDQVNGRELGGAEGGGRHRERAQATRVVFRWLVAHADRLRDGTAEAPAAVDATTDGGDAELVAAVAQWFGPPDPPQGTAAWGRPLHRIDLAAVVGRFVGETEKNLEALFADAARAGAVLLIDEADALFGRRTEVTDAHDRYADVGADDLLRRIERHDGVVVLADDLRRRIDAAGADERHLRAAYDEAAAGHAQGGCPIGGVLVDNDSGAILGQGHNALVQEGNPIVHGEMAALRAAGRLPNRHRTTMVTTLQPCFMCAGTIVQFGIPRVVIGDVANAASDETIRFMRSKGVEVVVMDPATSRAARDCVELVRRFRAERPELWLEDWGGGPNPALGAAPV
jgi:cytosine deaminase